jgi:ZIP family zinc transporter
MTPVLRITLLYSLVPVVFTVAGAALGAYWPAMARLRSYVLHLAAGVVFSVVAVELLPEIQRRALVGDVVLGFALGIATMLAVDKVLDRIRGGDADDHDDGDRHGKPPVGTMGLSMLVAVGVDFVIDGLLLGVGFAAGARIGILLALAEAAEQLSVGLALAGEMTRAGARPSRVLLVVSAIGTLVFVSAVLGATLLSGLSGGAMEVVLSFGVAALLYLVTEELLREAHEERETTLATAMFFAGFLAFLVIGMTLD